MSQARGLTSLFREQFEWCKVHPGEAAAILTETGSRENYVYASMAALTVLGARPFRVDVPYFFADDENEMAINRGNAASRALKQFPEIVDLLKHVGFIVDLTLEGLIHSEERAQILGGGARALVIREEPDALARLRPTVERMERLNRAVQLMSNAKQMTATSKRGTNLKIDLRGTKPRASKGFCDVPGSSATWGNAMVVAYPASQEIDGDVVLGPGDILYPFYTFVRDEVRLRVRGGFVESIDGDNLDGDLMREYMQRWNERNAYGISHVGWGLHEKAQWNAINFYNRVEALGADGRSYEGNFLLSTGPNHVANRHTECHFDIPMRNCNIFLDDTPIIREGRTVEPSLVFKAA
jgi:2,5-dihydroxypyridine 5,6-dioxygenase